MESLNLDQCPDGARVFVDTNILLYYFAGRSEQCKRFVERCLKNDIHAITSVVVLIETLHKLMVMEATQAGHATGENAAQYLRAHPRIVQSLNRSEEAIRTILDYFEATVAVDVSDLQVSRVLREKFGLLANDSLILTAMHRKFLRIIATADRDFRRIEDLRVYRPTDLTP